MTTKKKSAAPKTEPKVKVSKTDSPLLDGTIDVFNGNPTTSVTNSQIAEEEKQVKDPASDLRFRVGDIATHNGSNFLCIATNGQQCAVFVPSNIQTTYSRVVEQKCLLMNNAPIEG